MKILYMCVRDFSIEVNGEMWDSFVSLKCSKCTFFTASKNAEWKLKMEGNRGGLFDVRIWKKKVGFAAFQEYMGGLDWKQLYIIYHFLATKYLNLGHLLGLLYCLFTVPAYTNAIIGFITWTIVACVQPKNTYWLT